MKFSSRETVCVVAEKDDFKFTCVYVLEWRSKTDVEASFRVTVPRYASVDETFDLATSPEPIDFIPDYVKKEFAEAGNAYAVDARHLTATTIGIMDAMIEGEYDALDTIFVQGFDTAYGTYESVTEVSSK